MNIRHRSSTWLILWACLAFISGRGHAATYHVWTNSITDGPGTHWTNAFHEIQNAINSATNIGDIVLVTNGIYSTGGADTPGSTAIPAMVSRIVATNTITIKSVKGPDQTIILGQGPFGNSAIRCAFLTNGAVLSGFTLSNGYTRTGGNTQVDRSGGAAFISDGIITNCIIIGNSAWAYGGGAYGGVIRNSLIQGNWTLWDGGGVSHAYVESSTISGNSSQKGGGAYFGTLYKCIIDGNTASDDGGGGYSTTINNCKITSNRAEDKGGGVHSGTINNCFIARNYSGFDGGGAYRATANNCTIVLNSALLQCGGASDGGSPGVECNNSIVYYNFSYTAPDGLIDYQYSCTSYDYFDGPNCIEDPPELASLFCIATNSPVIGAGTNSYSSGTDIHNDAWLDPPSMGCDEYVAGTVTGPLQVAIYDTASAIIVMVNTQQSFSVDIDGKAHWNHWNFGDNTTATNRPYVTHTWASTGRYPVVLSAYNETYSEGLSDTVTVHVVEEPVTHYVDAGNPTPSYPYLTWAEAATNIQHAVNAYCQLSKRILVTNGVYSSGGAATPGSLTVPALISRVVATNLISIESVNGPEVTIIDGAGPLGTSAVRCAYLSNGSALSGFTLSNGHTRTTGAIFLDQSGGGAYAIGSFLTNCIVKCNESDYSGGGTYGGILNNCLLMSNRAEWHGGGAYGAMVLNCTIVGNTADQSGGGTYKSTNKNSIVYYNTASPSNNYFGGTCEYCCITPYSDGAGNITNEPAFMNYAANDLRLSSSSLCINAGNDAYAPDQNDAWGNERIRAFKVDIGAHESPYAIIETLSTTNGQIIPSGRIGVEVAGNQNFVITANEGFYVTNLTVDGLSMGGITFFELRNAVSNHVIAALFAAYPPSSTNVINATAGFGGTMEPHGVLFVTNGANQTFTISAYPVYAAIKDVRIDGNSTGTVSSYTFYNVTNNHIIEVFFSVYPDTNGCWISGMEITSDKLIMYWPAENGWLYNLQCSPTLMPAFWSNMPPYTNLAGSDEIIITNNIGAVPRMFYKLTTTEE